MEKKRVSKARSKGKGDHALRDSSTCVSGTNSHPPRRHQAASQRPRVDLLVSSQATCTAKLRHCSPPSDAPNKADARPPRMAGPLLFSQTVSARLTGGPNSSFCLDSYTAAAESELTGPSGSSYRAHSLLPVVMADRQSLLYGHLIGHRRDCETGTV